MAKGLTQRQADIYSFIVEFLEENQFPPTVREIADQFGIKSTNGVAEHIKALIRKGYLVKAGNKNRALRPVVRDGFSPLEVEVDEEDGVEEDPISLLDESDSQPNRPYQHARLNDSGTVREIPILGRIAAGNPINAFEDIEEVLSMDASLFCRGTDDVFALRVRGTSMIGDGIMPGDIVFVRPQSTAEQGELIAALVDGDATVKRYQKRKNDIYLIPSNPEMEPIVIHESDHCNFKILGAIRGVLRQYA